jgi:hypothetical protein
VRTARDKFGWPEPEEDEPVRTPAAPPAPFGGLPANVGPASPPAGPSAPPEAPEAPEAPEPDLEPEPPDDPEPLANSRTRAPDPTDPIVRARTAALTQAYRGSMAPLPAGRAPEQLPRGRPGAPEGPLHRLARATPGRRVGDRPPDRRRRRGRG